MWSPPFATIGERHCRGSMKKIDLVFMAARFVLHSIEG